MHCCWLLNRTGKEKQTLWVSVMVTLSMYHNNEHFSSLFVFIPITKLLIVMKCRLKIRYRLYFRGWGTYLVSLSLNPGKWVRGI